MTKSPCARRGRDSSLGLRHSFVIRYLSFVIPHDHTRRLSHCQRNFVRDRICRRNAAPQSHHHLDVARADAERGQSISRRFFSLPGRSNRSAELQRASLRLFHHHRRGCRSRGRPRHPRRSLSRPPNHRRERHQELEILVMSRLPWIILLAPLCSAAVITVFTLRWKALSSFISVAAVLVSFVCSVLVFRQSDISAIDLTWINIAGGLSVPLGLTLDQLSGTMLVLVSGVGAIIHIYSLGYMRADAGISRYFAALS